MDEATSSIDTRTEKLIAEGMDKLMEGRTVFVIAHRLSTIKNSHAIMVLEQGEIIERGNHDIFIRRKGKILSIIYWKSRIRCRRSNSIRQNSGYLRGASIIWMSSE